MSGTSVAISCKRCRGKLGSQQFYIQQQYTAEIITVGPICFSCYKELKDANGEEADGGKDNSKPNN